MDHSQITSDVVVHTWALARAVGADEHLDDDLVAGVESFLTPRVGEWRSAGAFGPPVECRPAPTGRPALLGHTGRHPS